MIDGSELFGSDSEHFLNVDMPRLVEYLRERNISLEELKREIDNSSVPADHGSDVEFKRRSKLEKLLRGVVINLAALPISCTVGALASCFFTFTEGDSQKGIYLGLTSAVLTQLFVNYADALTNPSSANFAAYKVIRDRYREKINETELMNLGIIVPQVF